MSLHVCEYGHKSSEFSLINSTQIPAKSCITSPLPRITSTVIGRYNERFCKNHHLQPIIKPHCTNRGVVPAKFNYRPILGLARGVFDNYALSNEIGVNLGNLDGSHSPSRFSRKARTQTDPLRISNLNLLEYRPFKALSLEYIRILP